jgi:hypothetical protein
MNDECEMEKKCEDQICEFNSGNEYVGIHWGSMNDAKVLCNQPIMKYSTFGILPHWFCVSSFHIWSKLELQLHWKNIMQLMRKLASSEFSPCISIWQLPHISIRWSNSIVDGWEMNHVTAIVMNGSNAVQIVDKLVGCQFLWDHWVQAVHDPSS